MKLKEYLRKRRQEKRNQKQTIANLKQRSERISYRLANEPLEPDARKALQEELKEVTTALEKFDKVRMNEKSGLSWFLRTLGSFLVAVLLMLISIVVPMSNNKFAEKAQRIFDSLSKMRGL